LDARMLFPELFKKVGEEAAGDQRIDADAQAALLAARHHAGCPYGMVEMSDACRHPLDEMLAGFRQPNAPRVTLEKQDAKVFLQSFYARADTGLRDAERVRCVAEVQIFSDGQRLNERGERNARSQRGR